MPESPEVEALVEFLDERMSGRVIRRFEVVDPRVRKTRVIGPEGVEGCLVSGVSRHGKLLDLALVATEPARSGDGPDERVDDDLPAERHLVVTLGRHGWVSWYERMPERSADPAAVVRVHLDDGGGFDLVDAGSFRSAGVWIVAAPADVPGVAKLGSDPADPGFSRADFDRVVGGRRKQVKAILQDQTSFAGIGNAYSDEILHLARVSPVVHAAGLVSDDLDRLFEALTTVVRGAIDDRRGVPIDRLKAAKTASMRVHGRAGERCPVCRGIIRDLAFSGTSAQYCPTCQTGGAPLAG